MHKNYAVLFTNYATPMRAGLGRKPIYDSPSDVPTLKAPFDSVRLFRSAFRNG